VDSPAGDSRARVLLAAEATVNGGRLPLGPALARDDAPGGAWQHEQRAPPDACEFIRRVPVNQPPDRPRRSARRPPAGPPTRYSRPAAPPHRVPPAHALCRSGSITSLSGSGPRPIVGSGTDAAVQAERLRVTYHGESVWNLERLLALSDPSCPTPIRRMGPSGRPSWRGRRYRARRRVQSGARVIPHEHPVEHPSTRGSKHEQVRPVALREFVQRTFRQTMTRHTSARSPRGATRCRFDRARRGAAPQPVRALRASLPHPPRMRRPTPTAPTAGTLRTWASVSFASECIRWPGTRWSPTAGRHQGTAGGEGRETERHAQRVAPVSAVLPRKRVTLQRARQRTDRRQR
jgi:hypothetical protein